MSKVQVLIPDALDTKIRNKFRQLVTVGQAQAQLELGEVQKKLQAAALRMHAGAQDAKGEWAELKMREEALIAQTQPLSVGAIFVGLIAQIDRYTDEELLRMMAETNIRQGRRMLFSSP